MTRPEDLLHNRELWDLVNDQFSGADGLELWRREDIAWGLFATPESEVGVLGDVAGLDVVELGLRHRARLGLARTARRADGRHRPVRRPARLSPRRAGRARVGVRAAAGRRRARAAGRRLRRPRDQRARCPGVVRAGRLDRRGSPDPAPRWSTGVPHQQPAVGHVRPGRGRPSRRAPAAGSCRAPRDPVARRWRGAPSGPRRVDPRARRPRLRRRGLARAARPGRPRPGAGRRGASTTSPTWPGPAGGPPRTSGRPDWGDEPVPARQVNVSPLLFDDPCDR